VIKEIVKSAFRYGSNLVDTPAVILLYHRVTNLQLDPQELAVSPENFETHLKILREKYCLIDIDEFSEIIRSRKAMPKSSVVITFDDGYVDNFYEALPILNRQRAQAIFYIATANIDSRREFWWDNLERIFLHGLNLPPALSFKSHGKSYLFGTATASERESTYLALHPVIKNCDVDERERLMDYILSWSGQSVAGRETHRMMHASEVTALANSPSAVIGAHTHNHPKLSVCSQHMQRREILASKEILEKLTRKPVMHFSYPFGTRQDYDRHSVAICKDLGLTMACANTHNRVHRWSNTFELPRMLVRNWNGQQFSDKMKFFFNG